jgi:hypothetical protein
MSRLRKGKKFKGGSFAQTFKQGIASNTPFAKVVVADQGADEEVKDLETRQQEAANDQTSAAARSDLSPKDEIPSDTDYSREEVDAYFQRRKLAKEQEALDKAKREQEEQAADEAEAAEEEREATSQGENIAGSFENEYDPTMTGKERRQESRENKKQIRDAKKTAKQTAKQEFKDKKQAIKDAGLKGKDKRQAKKSARQDKRADKKSIRQNKRAAKKSNRKAKRKARRNRRK